MQIMSSKSDAIWVRILQGRVRNPCINREEYQLPELLRLVSITTQNRLGHPQSISKNVDPNKLVPEIPEMTPTHHCVLRVHDFCQGGQAERSDLRTANSACSGKRMLEYPHVLSRLR